MQGFYHLLLTSPLIILYSQNLVYMKPVLGSLLILAISSFINTPCVLEKERVFSSGLFYYFSIVMNYFLLKNESAFCDNLSHMNVFCSRFHGTSEFPEAVLVNVLMCASVRCSTAGPTQDQFLDRYNRVREREDI